MLISAIRAALQSGAYDQTLASLYRPEDAAVRRARERFVTLTDEFLQLYGDREGVLCSVPGRTEISGNHTDHNRGCVLAASVDIDIIAVASATDDNTIRVKSAGYPEDRVDLTRLDPKAVRRGSSDAIIAGVCDAFIKNGYACGGFVACTASDVLTGSGLSSSAAFEVMCGRILSELYNNGSVPAMQLALFGQYAENVFFGKPCGLMDQAACACGGFLFIDFADPAHPVTEKLSLDPEQAGYTFCIVNTGGNHVDLTDDYAAIPAEMRSVAALMGKSCLRECDEADFLSRLPYIRANVGDRAILRALHFFEENARVLQQRDALKAGNCSRFLQLVVASGNSSALHLQNIYSVKNPAEQGLSLALALSEKLGAVCRVHGGGFAGTIQAYVPTERAEVYRKELDAVLGDGAVMFLHIRPYGACAITESGVREQPIMAGERG